VLDVGQTLRPRCDTPISANPPALQVFREQTLAANLAVLNQEFVGTKLVASIKRVLYTLRPDVERLGK
jgi:hypothetical protein